MDGRIIERLKKRVGTRNDEEINELAMSCVRELENTGVYGNPATDALYYQAMVLYCKANFGYDENTERFQTAFEKLRDSMALSGDYAIEKNPEGAELIWEKICKNENGFPERKRCSVEVYAMEKSVTRAEAYESMRAGVNARIILKLRTDDWEASRHPGEDGKPEYARKVIYEEAEYDIIRAYKKGKSFVEITCG